MKHKMTKACAIPRAVREAVYERDGGNCILCGCNRGEPAAHYISRAHGGLGVEENIFTACADCHRRYDNSGRRPLLREEIRSYLMSCYLDWNEENLVFRKR